MRKGFGFHDRHSPFRFDPAMLFIGGAVKGAYYDPSNITTLFQDDAGTTPVTAVEQTVGRILDLSGNANHATQSVAASRPTYRARYNRFTYTEEFGNADWQKTNALVTDNATTAPNGTVTADKLIANTTNAAHRITQDVSLAVNSFTVRLYAKAAEYSSFRINYISSANAAGDFNLANGVSSVSGTNGLSTSMTAEGNGWFRCVFTFRGQVALDGINIVLTNPYQTLVFAGDNVSGIFIWGAELLGANDVAIIGNAYQRVAAATSYDTSSPVWRPYLAFDGSNDSMLTSSIDFTGTDKMTVWAGVTKSSDAAQGVVAELSATIASNNGAFLLSAPNSAAANYNWSSKGTTQVDNTVTTYTAPNTAVLTGQANIAGPSNIIRVNGAQAGSVATTQGTGNFGNYPLYIGRRNNASLPFNGRLYGLIVLGAAASDWQVYVTEQWMAGKTGLQF